MGRLHFPTYGGRISCPPMGVGFISSAKVQHFFDTTKLLQKKVSFLFQKVAFFVYFVLNGKKKATP